MITEIYQDIQTHLRGNTRTFSVGLTSFNCCIPACGHDIWQKQEVMSGWTMLQEKSGI